MKRVKLFNDYLSMNSQMLGLSRQEYTSRFLSEKFDGIGDLVKSLHFEMDPKTAEEKKIELGYRQGEATKRKQIEGGNYSLRRFRKEIGYWDGNKRDQDWAEDVFAGPEHYNTIKSTLGAGPHAKKVKKVKWNQRKYNKWISDLAYDNDGVGQDSSYGFEMAQNAKHEPGLIGWVLKQYRGEDPIQIIQWDIEAAMESVVTEARAYKLKASEFGGDTFSAAYNVKGEPTWRVHSTYAIDQVSGENNSDERDVVFFEVMPFDDEIYIKIGGINNLTRTNGATVGHNFGTTVEEWKNNPMGIAKEASDFLTDATHLKWINKKAKSQGQKIKWALKDDYSSVIEDLVNKALGLKESQVNEFYFEKDEEERLQKFVDQLSFGDELEYRDGFSTGRGSFPNTRQLKNELDSNFQLLLTQKSGRNWDLYVGSDDLVFLIQPDLGAKNYMQVSISSTKEQWNDESSVFARSNGYSVYESVVNERAKHTSTDFSKPGNDGDIYFSKREGDAVGVRLGDKLQMIYVFQEEPKLGRIQKTDKRWENMGPASEELLIDLRGREEGKILFDFVSTLEESVVNEEKIKYAKGKTYQSSGHYTVQVDSNSSMCDIRVNHSAGWRLDPHDDREETWELLDNGRQRATLYFRRGSIDKFAQQMFDLNDRTTWGNKTKLTAKDYADIIRLWIDMKKANESVFNEKQKKYSDLWSPYQKADILAGDMFGEMGLFSLSDDQLDQIIDLKKADRLAKKQYGEFGFKTLAAKEMEELLDNNPKLLKESIIIEENTVTFTLDDGDLDDKFLGDRSLSRNLDYEQDGSDTYYVLPKRDFDRLEDWADSSGYNTAEVIYVIDEAMVSEKFSFSKKEVEKAANLIASAIAQADMVKTKVHHLEYDKGRGAGFDISIDGEESAGGSYVVKDNGDVVNAAIGNSHPNAVYNTIGNKNIADVFINMEKYESVVNEDDRTPTMLLADEIEGAEFHHGFGDGTEVDARSTRKTWGDGVPVLKHIARAPKKSVKTPTGKFEVVIDNKYGWIYWQEKGVWYGMEKEDEYIPFEF